MTPEESLSASKRFSPAPLYSGLAFALGMGICLWLITGSRYAAFHGGFWSGVVFAVVVAKIMNVSLKANAPAPDGKAEGFEGEERVVHYGLANHQKGIEAVGGKLYLTGERLRFRSHKLNFQTHDISWSLGEIESVEPTRSLGIIPNRILVRMKNGARESFVVSGREAWVTAIRSAIARGWHLSFGKGLRSPT